MLKSALGIFISSLMLAVAAPAAYAKTSTATKSSAKKHSAGKQATKQTAKRKAAPRRAREQVAHTRHKPAIQRASFSPSPAVPPVMTAGDMAGLNLTHDSLALKSNAVIVVDQNTSQVLFEKNSAVALPIASLTKLMTATVVVESHQNMDEVLEVTADDIDRERNSSSRLRVGSQMTRTNMLHIALMSSENRAASALGRNYPGGLPAFVAAMNAKAKALGMNDTHYVDSTGLSSRNMASARDLAKLVAAAHRHSIIREYSTDSHYVVGTGHGHQLQYQTSNRLVMNPSWEIGLQKTGYINEAGRCLVMQTRIEGRPVVMVFLDSKGKDSRLADAARVRKWLETSKPQPLAQVTVRQS